MLCPLHTATKKSKANEDVKLEGVTRDGRVDPFHMPAELADGLGVESLPRSKRPDSPRSNVVFRIQRA